MSETVEVVVGVVGRAHGIRGEFVVEPRTDEPDRRFADRTRLRRDGGADLVVASHRWHSGRLLVRFDRVTDRTAAEALRGAVLSLDVPLDEQPDDDGEYYDRQLVGLAVLDAAGARVGTVSAVLHLPLQDVLAVATADGERLVPFVTALVPDVDLAAGTLTLAEVPGLLTDEPETPDDDTGAGA